jgi:hypothetical protein
MFYGTVQRVVQGTLYRGGWCTEVIWEMMQEMVQRGVGKGIKGGAGDGAVAGGAWYGLGFEVGGSEEYRQTCIGSCRRRCSRGW